MRTENRFEDITNGNIETMSLYYMVQRAADVTCLRSATRSAMDHQHVNLTSNQMLPRGFNASAFRYMNCCTCVYL